MVPSRLISADSHVNEPQRLWLDRLDHKFCELAPHVTTTDEGLLVFIAPGIPPASVAQGFARGRSGAELKEMLRQGYEVASPGGWDPAARLKDQAVDGVEMEVLYTTLGMRLFPLPDKDLQRACFRVFNDWIAEFCAYAPDRLKALGLISVDDVAQAVAELERCAKIGLCGGMIPIFPDEERPYHLPIYDPLWAAAGELGMPLSLHASTGQRRGKQYQIDPKVGGLRRSLLDEMPVRTLDIQQSLASFIFGGVFKRFPKLRVVSVENGVGWLPFYIHSMDYYFRKYPWQVPVEGLALPSEYLAGQFFATFQDDPVAGVTLGLFGEDNYMWASDYPHADSTWPHSRQVIERDFGNLPAATSGKIVCGNAARLYHFPLN